MKRYVNHILIALMCIFVFTGCNDAKKAYKEGISLSEKGDYTGAARCFEKAVKENKDKAEYYIAYGLMLNNLGQYKKALKQFDKAYQKVDNKISRINNKQLYYGKAFAYFRQGDPDKAESFAKKAEKISESSDINSSLYALYGDILLSKGDISAAAGYYENAIKNDEEAYTLYFNLHDIYISENKETDAKNILEKVIKNTENNKEGYIYAGRAYYMLGKSEDAKTLFKKAVESGNTDAYYYMGTMYFDTGDYVNAIKYYKKYMAESKDVTIYSVYNRMAGAYINIGEYDNAEKYIKTGLKKGYTPAYAELLKNNVILYEKQNKYKLAKKAARKYLKEYPDDKEMKKEYKFIKTRITNKKKKTNPTTGSAVG